MKFVTLNAIQTQECCAKLFRLFQGSDLGAMASFLRVRVMIWISRKTY
jgi:predicted DNA-binding ribbon-helix-helix protein